MIYRKNSPNFVTASQNCYLYFEHLEQYKHFNMRNFIFAQSLLVFLIVSQFNLHAQFLAIPDVYRYKDNPTVGTLIKANDSTDNAKIFKCNRDFIYDYYIPITDVNNKSTKISIIPDWHLDGKDTILNFDLQFHDTPNSYLINKVRLKVMNKKIKIPKSADQTVVKYEYSNFRGVLNLLSEVSSVVETDSKVAIHQPSNSYFRFLEYAPNPEQNNLSSDNTWCESKEITLNRKYKNLQPLTLEFEYTPSGTKDVWFNNRLVPCQIIKAQSKPNFHDINSTATFLYNKEFGFLQMDYSVTVANNTPEKIIFNLERIEDKLY